MMTTKLLHDEHLVLASNQVHIVSETPNGYEVWLNTDVGDFDGLCIGCGESREAAVADAISVLEEGVRALKANAGDVDKSQPYKGPINQPCSACSAGDTAMEYHDHDYVKPENRR